MVAKTQQPVIWIVKTPAGQTVVEVYIITTEPQAK